jgi:Cu2+-exporting ATPase
MITSTTLQKTRQQPPTTFPTPPRPPTPHPFSLGWLLPAPQKRRPQRLIHCLTESKNSKNDDISSRSEPARQADRQLMLSAGLLAVTSLGTLPALSLLNLAALPGILYLNVPFVRQAWQEIVHERRVGISLIDGIIGFVNVALGYYWVECLFLTIFAFNQKYLLKTRSQSIADLIDVFGDQPMSVTLLVEGREVRRPFAELQVGDQVVVQTGALVPVDGRVVDGFALVDQHKLTGEAQPVERLPGSQVLANTVLLAGRLTIVVEQAGSATVAAQIGQILQKTADHKTALQSKGETLADQSALPVLGLSAFTLLILGPASAGAILFSSFGYLMRLLSPFSVLNFLQIAAREGILVKDGRALETLPRVDTVIFDKTGTLTLETLTVVRCHRVWPALSEDELLALAATVEQNQEHPIARALCSTAHQRQLALPATDAVRYTVGLGIQARLGDQLVQVGSERYLETIGVALPDSLRATAQACHSAGGTLVYVVVDHALCGAVELCPTLRPEAAQVVAQLQQNKLDVQILSGDHEEPTRRLAQMLGITTFHATVLPQDKAAVIAELRRQGRTVCFVGDGLNDALALREADVAISLHGASSVARDLAQVMLMHQQLGQLPRLFTLAHQLEQNQHTNLLISLLPGMLCLPGVYLLNFGVLAAGLLSNLSLLVGLANVALPLAAYRRQIAAKPPTHSQPYTAERIG